MNAGKTHFEKILDCGDRNRHKFNSHFQFRREFNKTCNRLDYDDCRHGHLHLFGIHSRQRNEGEK